MGHYPDHPWWGPWLDLFALLLPRLKTIVTFREAWSVSLVGEVSPTARAPAEVRR